MSEPNSATSGGSAAGGVLGFTAGDFIIDGHRGGGGGSSGGGGGSAGGGGGGWTMSREEAMDAAKDAREIADDFEEQVQDAERLARTRGPSDPASQAFTKVGNEAFAAGAEHVRAERDSWRSLADALEKALGTYEQADEQAGEDVGKSGGHDQSDGGLF